MEEMSIGELEIYREKLLEKYHSRKEAKEFADDDMEQAWLEEELEPYRIEIRACTAKISKLKSELKSDA